MFFIYSYQQPDVKFLNWLKEEYKSSKNPARSNLWANNWTTEENTLPYILESTDRFAGDRGDFVVLKYNDNIIGCAGVYISDFSSDIAIAGCRAWVTENFRNKALVRNYILPYQKQWAVSKGCKQIALTFNEYNKNLIETFKRTRLGIEKLSTRTNDHLFYNGLEILPFPVLIQNSIQWVIYESLDPNFAFDWKQLEWEDNIL
jgi:hypothetical protein